MDITLANLTVNLPSDQRQLFKIEKLQVASGSRVLIQGPSGKGKTTLLHIIAGLLPPSSGQVLLGKTDLQQLSEAEQSHFRRDNVSLIFQKLNLIPHMTAVENVLLAMKRHEHDPKKALDALASVNMDKHAKTFAADLSVGEQQRVAVARILTAKPTLILADEPTSSLDDENTKAVMDSLFKVAQNATLLVVSHDHRIRDRFQNVIDFERLAHA